ncbi:MAG: hypothetical protein PVH19_12630, partial [Planctomycetia bacterium]
MNTSIKYLLLVLIVSTSIVQAEIITEGNVSWNGTDAYIGKKLDGSLIVNSGDNITTDQGILGNTWGIKGTVTISDTDSNWDSNDIAVGKNGTGELNILNGGNVHNSNIVILGQNVGSIGTITVSGSDSKLDSDCGLIVGQTGTGNLNITENGMVVVQSTSTLMVDSNGSGQSFINMSAGGMLALPGETDDSLGDFLDLITGDDPIRWWNPTLNDWDSLTTATPDTDYTLDYLTYGPLSGYTRLTVHSEVTSTP